jgi:hypothetical protein
VNILARVFCMCWIWSAMKYSMNRSGRLKTKQHLFPIQE